MLVSSNQLIQNNNKNEGRRTRLVKNGTDGRILSPSLLVLKQALILFETVLQFLPVARIDFLQAAHTCIYGGNLRDDKGFAVVPLEVIRLDVLQQLLVLSILCVGEWRIGRVRAW